MKPLYDKDDTGVYLSGVERLPEANKLPKTDWATREKFTRMPIRESGDYEKLKEAILEAI